MPTVTALPLLDVVIGLTFLYFLLSVICSSITEIIASAFRLRARNLESGIRTLLGSKQAAERFFEGWRIESLGTPRWLSWGKERRPRKPSYILGAGFLIGETAERPVTERDAVVDTAPMRDVIEHTAHAAKLARAAAPALDCVTGTAALGRSKPRSRPPTRQAAGLPTMVNALRPMRWRRRRAAGVPARP